MTWWSLECHSVVTVDREIDHHLLANLIDHTKWNEEMSDDIVADLSSGDCGVS